MKETVIVTGGAGYIGSHTIIELIEKTDYNVVSIDNFSNSDQLTFNRIKDVTGVEVKNYNIDLCNRESLFNAVKEFNIIGVIHFAAFKSVPGSVENPMKYYKNNIDSLLNVLGFCVEKKILNFIFSSSCSVYGNINILPVKEDTPFNKAESPYAFTKQIGERILEDFSISNPEIKTTSLRYFNPVGAHISGKIGESPINPPTSLIPIITQTAIGIREKMFVHGTDYETRDGSCIRDYIHVSDIAKAHIKALDYLIHKKNKTINSIFNLGTGNGITVIEAIDAFKRTTNMPLNVEFGPRRDGDVEAIYSETTRSYTELNWEPEVDLETMMDSAWKWQQKNRD